MFSQKLPSDEAAALYLRAAATTNRIYPRNTFGCDLLQLSKTRQQWRSEGALVIFSTGVFDILHLNHLLALTKFRIIGAREYAARHQLPEASASPEVLRSLAASSKIRLVVSMDSDDHVARNKAFRPEKANCDRPILSWQNRALMLANQYISDPAASRPLVDAITSHGLGSCPRPSCAKHASDFVASIVQPDLIILNESNHATREKVRRNNGLNHVKIIATPECSAHHDPLLDGQVTSTAIVERALGTHAPTSAAAVIF